MAVTAEQICNIALLRVGQRNTIDDLNEATTEAQACKALYADSRDAVLATFPWPFATMRASLAALSTTARDGWAYVYGLPSDCLKAISIYSGERTPAADQREPFAIESDATLKRKVLLADATPATLIYIAQVTEPVRFDPLFVQALAWHLAADLALALPVKPAVAESMLRAYQLALAKAAAAALNEQQPDVPPDSELVRIR